MPRLAAHAFVMPAALNASQRTPSSCLIPAGRGVAALPSSQRACVRACLPARAAALRRTRCPPLPQMVAYCRGVHVGCSLRARPRHVPPRTLHEPAVLPRSTCPVRTLGELRPGKLPAGCSRRHSPGAPGPLSYAPTRRLSAEPGRRRGEEARAAQGDPARKVESQSARYPLGRYITLYISLT